MWNPNSAVAHNIESILWQFCMIGYHNVEKVTYTVTSFPRIILLGMEWFVE